MRIFASGWSFDKDGPGQRLVFYLKGCNMRCIWCANPEGMSPDQEMLFYPERCSGTIDYVCSRGAINDKSLNRVICRNCAGIDCVRIWHHKCFELAGEYISPDEILALAETSRDMFGRHGGITFGGGEATLQTDELLKSLRLLHEHGINTVIESNASTLDFVSVAQIVDYLICDLKAVSDTIHRSMTGISNELILNNLNMAGMSKKELLIRIPVVTGLNTGQPEIKRITSFLADLHQRRLDALGLPLRVELLRMHHASKSKYAGMGLPYPMTAVELPGQDIIAEYKQELISSGIEIVTT